LQSIFDVIAAQLKLIPAKAGSEIKPFQPLLGPGFPRGDGFGEFCKSFGYLFFAAQNVTLLGEFWIFLGSLLRYIFGPRHFCVRKKLVSPNALV